MENFRYKSEYLSPLGPMTMAGDGECLTGLWFDGQKYLPASLLLDSTPGSLPVFDRTRVWPDSYIAVATHGRVPLLRL